MENKTPLLAFLQDDSNMTLDLNMKPVKTSARKLAEATEIVEKYLVPQQKKLNKPTSSVRVQKLLLTDFQKELIELSNFPVSEEKRVQIKAFLQQILADEIAENASKKTSKEEELTALAA